MGFFYYLENVDDHPRTVYENCPLIEHLSIVFSSSSLTEFEKLLDLSKIKGINNIYGLYK